VRNKEDKHRRRRIAIGKALKERDMNLVVILMQEEIACLNAKLVERKKQTKELNIIRNCLSDIINSMREKN